MAPNTAAKPIRRAADLIKPGPGETVFYLRVGGEHTQLQTHAASGVAPQEAIKLAMDALAAEAADALKCPEHDDRGYIEVSKMAAAGALYDGLAACADILASMFRDGVAVTPGDDEDVPHGSHYVGPGVMPAIYAALARARGEPAPAPHMVAAALKARAVGEGE